MKYFLFIKLSINFIFVSITCAVKLKHLKINHFKFDIEIILNKLQILPLRLHLKFKNTIITYGMVAITKLVIHNNCNILISNFQLFSNSLKSFLPIFALTKKYKL